MTALYMPSSTAWGPPQHLQHRSTPDVIFPVAYSVAEAALKSGPNSPSFGQSMNCLMDAAALDSHWGGNANVASWPKVKTRRVASFAGRGRPLWEVVEHAKERREKKSEFQACDKARRKPHTHLWVAQYGRRSHTTTITLLTHILHSPHVPCIA